MAFNVLHNNRTIANMADLGVADDDPALRSRLAELNTLAATQPAPSPDSILADNLFLAWSQIYGDKKTWPRELVESYKTVTSGMGFSSFESGLISALQDMRTKVSVAPALQVALEVIGLDNNYAHVAPKVRTAMGAGLVPESAAMAGLDFVESPINLIVPIYGGVIAGRLVGALVARFGTTLGLTAEALAGIGTVSSTVAEGAGFVASSHVIASPSTSLRINSAKQSSEDTFMQGIASAASLSRNDMLTEIGSATLFFGMLRSLGSGTNLLASLFATGETGIAAARVIGHAGAVTSLAATEELQEMAGIAPKTSEDFGARMWHSLFLYTTLSATRGVIGEITGQPNAAHQISAEALEMFRSMQRALTQPQPVGVIARSVSDEAIPRDHSMSGDPRLGGSDIRVNSAEMRASTKVRGCEPVTMPPPPPPQVRKQWGVYVIQVPGHGLAPDYAKMDNQMAVQGTTGDVHIVLRGMGKDGRLVNRYAQTVDLEHDGLFDKFASGPEASRHLGKNILDADALATFLIEAAEQFPADRVCVSFEGHSGDLRRFIPEIHAALAALKNKLGRDIDLILFDSCFMAQIEIATEFSDVADYMNASQEGVVTFRSFPRISRFIAKDRDTSPRELAIEIARNNREFTFSAIDLKRLVVLNQAIQALGYAILAVENNRAFRAIRKAMRDATGYYTEGLFSHNHFSNTVDFKGFVRGIYQNRFLRKNFPAVTKAAAEVLLIFGKEGDGVIVKERHASKTDQYYLDFTDVRGSYGLSIHQRITPKWLWNAYTHLRDSVFNKVTGWNKVTDHITSDGTIFYNIGSILRFAGGAITAGVNNGLQRVVEIWKTYWFNRKMKNAKN